MEAATEGQRWKESEEGYTLLPHSPSTSDLILYRCFYWQKATTSQRARGSFDPVPKREQGEGL